MSHMEWITMSLVVGMLAGFDLAIRRCPNWLSLPIIAAGVAIGGAEAMWSGVGIGVVMAIAKFPPGDVKGAAAMAVWAPMLPMLAALCLTMLVTVVLMETQWYKLYQHAYRWPWLAGLALSLTISLACGTLLVQ